MRLSKVFIATFNVRLRLHYLQKFILMTVKVLGTMQQQALADMSQKQYISNDVPMVDVDGIAGDTEEAWVDVPDDEAFARALEETSVHR